MSRRAYGTDFADAPGLRELIETAAWERDSRRCCQAPAHEKSEQNSLEIQPACRSNGIPVCGATGKRVLGLATLIPTNGRRV